MRTWPLHSCPRCPHHHACCVCRLQGSRLWMHGESTLGSAGVGASLVWRSLQRRTGWLRQQHLCPKYLGASLICPPPSCARTQLLHTLAWDHCSQASRLRNRTSSAATWQCVSAAAARLCNTCAMLPILQDTSECCSGLSCLDNPERKVLDIVGSRKVLKSCQAQG